MVVLVVMVFLGALVCRRQTHTIINDFTGNYFNSLRAAERLSKLTPKHQIKGKIIIKAV